MHKMARSHLRGDLFDLPRASHSNGCKGDPSSLLLRALVFFGTGNSKETAESVGEGGVTLMAGR
jgi:hypothetical protein